MVFHPFLPIVGFLASRRIRGDLGESKMSSDPVDSRMKAMQLMTRIQIFLSGFIGTFPEAGCEIVFSVHLMQRLIMYPTGKMDFNRMSSNISRTRNQEATTAYDTSTLQCAITDIANAMGDEAPANVFGNSGTTAEHSATSIPGRHPKVGNGKTTPLLDETWDCSELVAYSWLRPCVYYNCLSLQPDPMVRVNWLQNFTEFGHYFQVV